MKDDTAEPTGDACDVAQHDHGAVVEAALDALASDEIYGRASDLFGAFADPNRLKILDVLRSGVEICVSDLITITGMSQSAVSHALKLLRSRRIVAHRREGRHIYYRLDDEHVASLLESGLEHVTETDVAQ